MSPAYAVAIVHYHLRPGGVSRVIRTASRGLADRGIPHVILSGESGDADLPVVVLPGLGYRSDFTSPDGPQLAASLKEAADRALGCLPVIWHFHNHSLGRNPAIAGAAACLADSGAAMVLQLHDLAEDGRPDNYATIADEPMLYPHGPRVRLAFLNSHDLGRFRAAGLPAGHAVLLPNAVELSADPSVQKSDNEELLVFYPVRAIRRKNLGEIFLLAALSPPGARYAVSRAPESQRWMSIYDEWRSFAKESGLPVQLEASGASADFASWMRRATHCVTTSVAEGFGFAFLEPAAAGKPLFGRDIPAVTDDLRKAGLSPGALYQRILIPIDWIGESVLLERLSTAMESVMKRYRRSLSDRDVALAFATMTDGRYLDFANLPEDLQRDVILRAMKSKEILIEFNGRTEPAREALSRILLQGTHVLPKDLDPWSAADYALQLERLYGELIEAPATPPASLPKDRILSAYLYPASFHFLLS